MKNIVVYGMGFIILLYIATVPLYMLKYTNPRAEGDSLPSESPIGFSATRTTPSRKGITLL
jgi:hypothetical protein